MLNSQNSNFANPVNQTHDSRESNSGKEKAQIGAKIMSVINENVSNGTEGGVIMDLYIRMERGPNGKWGGGGLAGPRFLRWTLRLVKFHTQSPLTIISPNKNLFLSGGPYHPGSLSLPFLHKIRPTHTVSLPCMFLSLTQILRHQQ